MKLDFYQVDAFTGRAFGGNPAAVMPLEAWLPDAILQAIAMENNLSETAFFVPVGERRFHLRWFTPAVEVPLCGHATLASAHVILRQLHADWDAVQFDTQSGLLTGSIHCALVPLWAAKRGRTKLSARQVSKRMGELHCEIHGARVAIAGQAVTVIEGRFLA